ncbi:DUF2905 domain-containing protein [Natranaerofaba carboxydovora]|uniref:DUF2905 domain-containing protein n=1 Tax=Natranaerofaba carboxydovora TaxID=2742683 RepID=UPI001F14600B|nr:DUF2905 domain-containing protein [Natranaerofaba carboxydovora]UMZ74021.1 hypothetical protein ACONDI_01592 [Natranaerofaba carboxydovora]
MFDQLGRILTSLGVLFLIVGGALLLFNRISGIGRLPGDIFIQRGNFTFFFPITTAIIVSIILSLILNFVIRR